MRFIDFSAEFCGYFELEKIIVLLIFPCRCPLLRRARPAGAARRVAGMRFHLILLGFSYRSVRTLERKSLRDTREEAERRCGYNARAVPRLDLERRSLRDTREEAERRCGYNARAIDEPLL